jgi:hypothetical protein
MPEKITVLRKFNTYFLEFVNSVLFILPNNKDIMKLKTLFENMKSMNPSLFIKCWYKFVYFPYKEHIDAGNIDYFLTKQYNTDLHALNEKTRNDILQIIDGIREPLLTMDESNKAVYREYIKNLSLLSNLYAFE